MPAYMHWIVYIPFAVFCATAAISLATASLSNRAPKLAPAKPAPAKIYYFAPVKTSLRSNPAPARENLRLASNGG